MVSTPLHASFHFFHFSSEPLSRSKCTYVAVAVPYVRFSVHLVQLWQLILTLGRIPRVTFVIFCFD
jgi:hypothetical protein